MYSFVDLDANKHLTLKGFLQMYACQCIADAEETWKDLAKHGFPYEYIQECLLLQKPVVKYNNAAAGTLRKKKNKRR